MLAEDDGGGVVEEAAEGAAAERVVLARVQDEFVPEIVGDLRGHRDVALAAHQVGEEKLPQAPRDQRAVLALKAGVMLLQPLEQPRRPAIGADEFGAPKLKPPRDYRDQYGRPDTHQRDRHNWRHQGCSGPG